jgi:hypothetical protein
VCICINKSYELCCKHFEKIGSGLPTIMGKVLQSYTFERHETSFPFCSINSVFSNSNYILLDNSMVREQLNNELERIWKEAVMVYFDVLAWHLHAETGKPKRTSFWIAGIKAHI